MLKMADTQVSLHYDDNHNAYKQCGTCGGDIRDIGINEYEGLTTVIFACVVCGIVYLGEYSIVVGLQFGLADLQPTQSPNVVLGECSTEYCHICNTTVNVGVALHQGDDDGRYEVTLSFSCDCFDGRTYNIETLS